MSKKDNAVRDLSISALLWGGLLLGLPVISPVLYSLAQPSAAVVKDDPELMEIIREQSQHDADPIMRGLMNLPSAQASSL